MYQQISLVLDDSYQVIFWYATLQIQSGNSILVDKDNNSTCKLPHLQYVCMYVYQFHSSINLMFRLS